MDFDRYLNILRRTAEESRINFDRLCANYCDDGQVRRRELDRANAAEAKLKQDPDPRIGMDAATAEALLHRFAFEEPIDQTQGFYANAALQLRKDLGLDRERIDRIDDPAEIAFENNAVLFFEELSRSRVIAVALNADKSITGARLDLEKDVMPAEQLRRGIGRARLTEKALDSDQIGKEIVLESKIDTAKNNTRMPFGRPGFKAELNARTRTMFAHHGFYRAETPLNTVADLWNESDTAFKKKLAPLAAGIFGAAADITYALSSSRVAAKMLEDNVPNLFGVAHDYQALAADAEARRAPRQLVLASRPRTDAPTL